jgi:hypothetical protein
MMRSCLMCLAAMVAMLCSSSSVEAALAYSFEPDLEGFGPNGGGISVTQDTIGATEGSNSMKVDIVAGPTFVGALTSNVTAPIGDPPGVESILFDMTIDTGDEYTGGFAVVGVTIFGASQPDYPGGQLFGIQAQFADFEHIDGKAAGTYTDVQIDLSSATHPLTFALGQSFNEIFGTVGSGPNDVIPTGFQLFFNQSGAPDAAPVTVYIDNIRTVVPEPTSIVLIGVGAMILSLGVRRRTR